MPAIIRYLSSDEGLLNLAIIADETRAEYVWPDDTEPWFDGEARLEDLLEFEAETPPTTPEEWLSLASNHLSRLVVQDYDADTLEAAREIAQNALDVSRDPENSAYAQPALQPAQQAWDEVSRDFPDLGDDDAEGDMNPQATLNWVLMTLGPIDPEGPNGFLLRAADGNPAPGDENAFIHWGAPSYDPEEVPSE